MKAHCSSVSCLWQLLRGAGQRRHLQAPFCSACVRSPARTARHLSNRSWSSLPALASPDRMATRVRLRSARSPAIIVQAAASSSAAPSTQTKRRVRHILLPVDQSNLFTKLQHDLAGGAQFEKLAQQHSTCPSAKRGGELGWMKRGMGVPPVFEDAVFDADIGETTTAETDKGLHILQVVEERESAEVQTLTVDELADMLQRGEAAAQFIDVREQGEYDIARLPHFKLLPLSRFPEWSPGLTQSFDPEKSTVCLCHAGIRSMQMANLLIDQGFTKVYNVSGGIDAYSCYVDNSVPRY